MDANMHNLKISETIIAMSRGIVVLDENVANLKSLLQYFFLYPTNFIDGIIYIIYYFI